MGPIISSSFFFLLLCPKLPSVKNLICEETVMNYSGLAKFNTSQVHETSKVQCKSQRIPVNIRYTEASIL